MGVRATRGAVRRHRLYAISPSTRVSSVAQSLSYGTRALRVVVTRWVQHSIRPWRVSNRDDATAIGNVLCCVNKCQMLLGVKRGLCGWRWYKRRPLSAVQCSAWCAAGAGIMSMWDESWQVAWESRLGAEHSTRRMLRSVRPHYALRNQPIDQHSTRQQRSTMRQTHLTHHRLPTSASRSGSALGYRLTLHSNTPHSTAQSQRRSHHSHNHATLDTLHTHTHAHTQHTAATAPPTHHPQPPPPPHPPHLTSTYHPLAAPPRLTSIRPALFPPSPFPSKFPTLTSYTITSPASLLSPRLQHPTCLLHPTLNFESLSIRADPLSLGLHHCLRWQ